MKFVVRTLGGLAIATGVVSVYFAYSLLGFRYANSNLAVAAVAVLPACYWMRRPLLRPCLAFLLPASILIAFPVDVVLKSSYRPGVRGVRASHGDGCSSEACYGCIVGLNDAKWVLLVAVPR